MVRRWLIAEELVEIRSGDFLFPIRPFRVIVIDEDMEHHHLERDHQGLVNRLVVSRKW